MSTEARIEVEPAEALATPAPAEPERGFILRMGDEALWLLRCGIWGCHVAARWLAATLIGQAVGLWLVTRLLCLLLTLAAVLFGGPDAYTRSSVVTAHLVVSAWDRGDTHYYLQIAQHGYEAPWLTVFPPLYPALVAGVTALVGPTHALVVALLVSGVGMLGACVALAALAQHEMRDAHVSRQSVRMLLTYPLAFFLAAGYTEGLFIAFAALALLSARRGWWYRAALCAWLATETRISGVALFLPLLVEFGRQSVWWQQVQGRTHPWRHVLRSMLPGVAVLAAVPLALGIQALISQRAAHDPLAFIHAERGWGHHVMWPWQSIGLIAGGLLHAPVGSYDQARALLDVVPILVCGALTLLAAWRRWLPSAFVLYSAGLVLLSILAPISIISSDPAASAGRYLLAALPVTLLLAKWAVTRPWLDTLLVVGGFMLQSVLLVYWLNGGWIV